MFTAVYLDPERSVIVRVVDHKMQTWTGPGYAKSEGTVAPLTQRDLVTRLVGELHGADEVLVMGPESPALKELRLQLLSDRQLQRRVARLATEPKQSNTQILRRVQQVYLRRGPRQQNMAAGRHESSIPTRRGSPAERPGAGDARGRSSRLSFPRRAVKSARNRGRD